MLDSYVSDDSIDARRARELVRFALVALACLILVSALQAQIVVRLPDKALDVREVKEVPTGSGQVWVIAKSGAYRVQGDKAERVPDEEMEVSGVEEIGGEAWLATSKGAYRVADGKPRPIRISDPNPPIAEIKQVGTHVWLLGPNSGLAARAYLVHGDKAQRVPNNELLVRDIRTIGGQVWLLTTSASGSGGPAVGPAYRVTAGELKRIPDKDLYVRNIKEIPAASGQFWLDASQGLYRVRGEDHTLVWRSLPRQEDLSSIQEVRGEVWFLTSVSGGRFGVSRSAFRMDGNEPKRVFDEGVLVRNVISAGGNVWLITDKNLYRMDGNIPKRVFDEDLSVEAVKEIGMDAWVATSKGAYRVVDGEPRSIRIADPNPWISQIKKVGPYVWLLGRHGTALAGPAYQVQGNTAKRIPDEDLVVDDIQEVAGQVWLRTIIGAYRVEGDTAKLILKQVSPSVARIKEINGKIWLQTISFPGALWIPDKAGPLYRVDGDVAREFPGEKLAVRKVEQIGRHLWLQTDKGVYRVEGDTAKQTSTLSARVRDITAVASKVWWWTDQGAFRFDEAVSMQIRLQSTESWWMSVLDSIVPGVWLSGVNSPVIRYVDGEGKDAYRKGIAGQFSIIMEDDRGTFDARVRDGNFEPADRSQRNLSAGRHKFYVRVRDQWGNTLEKELTGVAVPGPVFLPIAVAVLWVIAIATIIALAPYWSFCHNLLMNPWLRKWGSFGLAPLAMTVVPVIQKHVLRRYRRGIRHDGEFTEMQARFVVPAEAYFPHRFSPLLSREKVLLLLGESGIGKTHYFMCLTGCYAAGYATVPRGVLPVYIPLGVYQQEDPEEMFHAQLDGYGQLADKELSAWFLRQGGFVIFLDGLNEVRDPAQRDRINAFIRNHRLKNLFCISSQQGYQEFSWIAKLELTDLSPEKLKELLQRRVGVARAATILSKFTKATYETYRIPQDLELAVALVEQHGDRAFPATRRELYEAVLDPISQAWVERGRPEYSDLLFARAYGMLCAQDSIFDQEDDRLPDEIRDDLVEKKFIVRRGDRNQIRHDLIRAYLAAKHFRPRWRELLSQATSIDSNWRSMLEFVLQEIYDCAPSEAEERRHDLKDLLVAILDKNTAMAMDLFKWLKRCKPSYCKDWEDEFYRRYGKATSESGRIGTC